MTLPPALFLDLDDTILADSEAAKECWMCVCVRYAGELPGITAQTLYDAVTQTGAWYWSDPERHRKGRTNIQTARREVVSLAFSDHGIHQSQVALQLADDYTFERRKLIRPFPGALDTLEELARRGIQLALLTNGEGSYQREKIARFGLEKYFQCIVVEGEFGIGKPNEVVFRHALKSVARDPQEVWMVGDNLTMDIAPALGLGMQGIWVDHTQKGLPSMPCCTPSQTIYSITELLTTQGHGY